MSSYDGFMSCTLVTPNDAACFSAPLIALVRCASVIFGMTRWT